MYFLKNLRAQFEKEERLSEGLEPVDQDILDSQVNEQDDSLNVDLKEILQRQSMSRAGMQP